MWENCVTGLNTLRRAFTSLSCAFTIDEFPLHPIYVLLTGYYSNLILCSLHRQIIARGLLDVFRDFSNNEEDFLTVMEIVVRLSEDAGLKVFSFLFKFF